MKYGLYVNLGAKDRVSVLSCVDVFLHSKKNIDTIFSATTCIASHVIFLTPTLDVSTPID